MENAFGRDREGDEMEDEDGDVDKKRQRLHCATPSNEPDDGGECFQFLFGHLRREKCNECKAKTAIDNALRLSIKFKFDTCSSARAARAIHACLEQTPRPETCFVFVRIECD